MKTVTDTIMPNVILTCVETNKFKTGCLSMNFLTPLDRSTAAMNALIPSVLRRGTVTLRDMTALYSRLDSLYGSGLTPIVRKKGEVQTVGFMASFPDDAFVPEGNVLDNIIPLMGEVLLMPNTHGGLLRREYVESERDQLLESIRGRVNDKRSYALQRLFELMCVMEAYSVDKLGSESSAESITPQGLSRHYKELIASSPLEIFYCGTAGFSQVRDRLCECLSTLPRNREEPDIGTDIWMSSLEDEPRYFQEEMQVGQGKLALGFRLGDCMEDPDAAAINVFNGVYGGCVTSKLFMNVRERLSLAYYASSAVDLHKGVMAVSSGIEFDKYSAALDEIFAQLEAVKKGDFTSQELSAAKRSIAGGLRSVEDSAFKLEDFSLNRLLSGPDCSPSELAQLTEEVTAQQVAEIAGGLVCDAVYFLRGPKEEQNGN